MRVLATVIRRDGRLLVCQRPSHKRHGGLWEFPGGKVEPGESDLAASRRELAEELGVEKDFIAGDCRAPRRVFSAVHEGYAAGLKA